METREPLRPRWKSGSRCCNGAGENTDAACDAIMQQLLLPEILRLHGRWRASHPAVVADGEVIDWMTFDRRTEQVANGLRAAGCADGERVGVVMNNSPETVEIIFGAMK